MSVLNSAYQSIINQSTITEANELMPSKTFKIDTTRTSVIIDNKAAIEQAVKKIVFTDRYRWKIYSSSYGIDLDKYIGKDLSYVQTDLPLEINRALKYDDRVLSIQNLKIFKTSLDQCICTFTVNTIFGKIQISGEI